jgi:hypothetical protein
MNWEDLFPSFGNFRGVTATRDVPAWHCLALLGHRLALLPLFQPRPSSPLWWSILRHGPPSRPPEPRRRGFVSAPTANACRFVVEVKISRHFVQCPIFRGDCSIRVMTKSAEISDGCHARPLWYVHFLRDERAQYQQSAHIPRPPRRAAKRKRRLLA